MLAKGDDWQRQGVEANPRDERPGFRGTKYEHGVRYLLAVWRCFECPRLRARELSQETVCGGLRVRFFPSIALTRASLCRGAVRGQPQESRGAFDPGGLWHSTSALP